jgi:RHS repeat-associated protein
VTGTSNGGSFVYDYNGNMTSRRLQTGGPTYTQTWDYDNRLASVTVPISGSEQTTTFTYDGNGALVKKESGGETTVHVGSYYEKNVTTGQVTQYYFFNGQRIAVRQGDVLYYIAGDHLGTTSVVLDASGNKVAESRHYPYGVERWSSGTLPTDYRFTGQRFEAGLGIYAMGVRWYDPYIDRFLSPDTIIPQPENPQSLNRYSYGYNNPLRYIDLTGHMDEDWVERFQSAHGHPPTEQDWWDYLFSLQIENWSAALWGQTYGLRMLSWEARVTVEAGDVRWQVNEVAVLGRSISRIAQRFGGDVARIVGGATVEKYSQLAPWWNMGQMVGGYEENLTIYMSAALLALPDAAEHAFVHEFGHYFDENQGLIGSFLQETGGRAFFLKKEYTYGKASTDVALLYFPGGIPRNDYAASNPYEDLAVSFEEYVYSSWSPLREYWFLPMDVTRYAFFERFRK